MTSQLAQIVGSQLYVDIHKLGRPHRFIPLGTQGVNLIQPASDGFLGSNRRVGAKHHLHVALRYHEDNAHAPLVGEDPQLVGVNNELIEKAKMHLAVRKYGDQRARSLSTDRPATASIIVGESKEMAAANDAMFDLLSFAAKPWQMYPHRKRYEQKAAAR